MTTKLLRQTTAPRLPNATGDYSVQAEDAFRRILGLYFAQIDNGFTGLLGPAGGKYLNIPHGAFESRTTQTASVINTATLLTLDTTSYSNGMYAVVGDGIHVEQSGVYNVQFSVQLTNTDTQAHDMALWLRQNGVDVPYSSSVVTVPGTHGGQPGYNVMAANFFVDMTAGDYVEFWWATNSLQVQINTLPPITSPFVNPGAPGFVVTVSFVSAPLR